MVEPQPSKLVVRVRFPSPALSSRFAAVAQLVERVLGKDEVTGSSPVSSFVYVIGWFRFNAESLIRRFLATQRKKDPGKSYGQGGIQAD